MTNKIRISKKMETSFPAPVADRIKSIADHYGIKSLSFETVNETYRFYVGEGERFTGIDASGRSASFEVVSEHTLGASGLSHRIGERFSMPTETYLIRVHYYTKYFMDVYHIGPKMVTA